MLILNLECTEYSTAGLILFYKYYAEWWQLNTIEADSSYKLYNRNRVFHFTSGIYSELYTTNVHKGTTLGPPQPILILRRSLFDKMCVNDNTPPPKL